MKRCPAITIPIRKASGIHDEYLQTLNCHALNVKALLLERHLLERELFLSTTADLDLDLFMHFSVTYNLPPSSSNIIQYLSYSTYTSLRIELVTRGFFFYPKQEKAVREKYKFYITKKFNFLFSYVLIAET